MHITRIKDMLAERPFFQGLSPAHLNMLAGCASNKRFSRGEFLFQENEKADCFYMIKHGAVAIESPAALGQLTLQQLGPGDIAGFSWLLPPHVWKFNALAIEPVSAIHFGAACIREKCEDDHDLGYELMTRVAILVTNSLDAARTQLLDYL